MTLPTDFSLKDGRIVTIRSYEPGDLDAMVFMFSQLNEEALQYGLPPYDRTRLERWVSAVNGGILLLVLDRDKVVGVATIWASPQKRRKGIGEFATYIHQDYHGKGLGTFLTK
ncbi:MAG TPA: GNAT family N-acetyltransferase, partial [Candidatus Dormibacteraeota bacterium]|nr:GNAT family N-acetyltransferase [Candidatus Dormibacteraeota bacterium]